MEQPTLLFQPEKQNAHIIVKTIPPRSESKRSSGMTIVINCFCSAGVIIYGSDQEVLSLMKAVRRNNATGNFSWIGSDGWSARTMVSETNELEVEGCLSVQPQSNPVDGFEEYFLGLNVENNKRNPWFTGTKSMIIIKHGWSF